MIRIFNQYVAVKSILLFLLETGLIVLAFVCGVRLRFWSDARSMDLFIQSPAFLWQTITVLIVFQVCFLYGNMYTVPALLNRTEQVICLGNALGIGTLVLGVGFFVFPYLLIGRGVFVISTILVGAFVIANRMLLETVWQAAQPPRHVLVLGAGELAFQVAQELGARSDLGVRLVGFLGESDDTGKQIPPGLPPMLGGPGALETVVREQRVSRIVVAMENRRNSLPVRGLLRLRVQGVAVEDVHTTLAGLTGRVWLKTLQPSWFVFSDGFRRSALTMVTKRVCDVLLAGIGLVLTLPLIVMVAIAVLLDSGRPILFRQKRVGLRGRPFDLLKFRSMRTDAEVGGKAQWATANDPRVTRTGRFLRKYRLDELPQFINILRANMSFVGPRPERPEFVEQLCRVIPYYDERHVVRPGLTGWAQVQYSYGSNIEETSRKLEYDLFYLKNLSFFLDVLILIKTLRIVFTGHGAR